MTHKKLIERAAQKMANTWRLPVVLKEPYAHSLTELPDCVGFDWGPMRCVMIECKTSRGDLLADKAKFHRDGCGVGRFRYYLCEKGKAESEDVPDTWGLLYICGKQTRTIKAAPDRLRTEDLEQTVIRQRREQQILATQLYPHTCGCYSNHD